MNDTFRGMQPTWANACVGNNGNPSYQEYFEGFSVAANQILDAVINSHGLKYSVDIMIYPICFNMRHSVELRLKYAIKQLIVLFSYRHITLQFDFDGSHDILLIWQFYEKNAIEFDSRFRVSLEKIKPVILDIAEMDRTGQTFRYPHDIDNNKHLTETPVINLINLRSKFNNLEENLDSLNYLNKQLLEEYSLGSFTKKLSRNQLLDLARRLPNADTWLNHTFKITKKQIQAEFLISSNDLSKAINIIKSNYELANLIDIKLNILGLTDEKLILFIRNWIKLHPNYNQKTRSNKTEPEILMSSEIADNFLENLYSENRIKISIWERIRSDISPEYIAGINSLFYFARNLTYSEYYKLNYDKQLKEAILIINSDDQVKENIFHILDKTNFLYNCLNSLQVLSQTKLIDTICNEFSIE